MAYDQAEVLLANEKWPKQPKPGKQLREFRVDGVNLETSPVFDAYWHFAAERQRIFFKRIHRTNAPVLSDDPIFQTYKFTNSYRASDRVSQFLISQVIYPEGRDYSAEDIFFRIMLFKLFNKIQTWEALEAEFGDLSLRNYNFERFNDFLTDRHARGERVYAAAYIMPSAGRVFGYQRKHSNHLALIEWMLEEDYPKRLGEADSMGLGFEIFISAPSLGPFLSYQFITDINYSPLTEFSEMDFVVPGPGALDGISKCFPNTQGISPAAIIRAVAEQQHAMFTQRGIDFPSLWDRDLQLIDCQNLFCEISKYSRVAYPGVVGVAGRTRIKQKYKPTGPLNLPFYPPKWNLNEKICSEDNRYIVREGTVAQPEQLELL